MSGLGEQIGPMWQRAASFAARAHAGAVRKDGATPYVAHPVRVAMTVIDVFGCRDETALCAALLHDTIEDTGVDYDDIEEAFGADVADCVAAVTKNMAMPEAAREVAYDEQLRGSGWRAHVVKLADVYDNFSDAVADGRTGASLQRVRDRVDRAIDVASPATEPAVVRALDAVRGLVERVG